MDAIDILVPLISVAGALVGLYVGARLTADNERTKRQLDFIDRQLKEFFYQAGHPLRHTLISEARERAAAAAHAAQDLCGEASGPEGLRDLRDRRCAEFESP